jgi:hypothetical protein
MGSRRAQVMATPADARDFAAPPSPLLTAVYRKDARELRFFSTIATVGAPHDVTLDELRIECSFPADDATDAFCRTLAAESRYR